METKLFIHGSCDLYDILDTKIIKKNFTVVNQSWNFYNNSNTSLDMNRMRFPGTGSSLRSIYTDPGPIALRVYDSLINKPCSDKINSRHSFQEILKFPYFNFFEKHSTTNDYLILSFGSECFSKCEVNNECFTCIPNMIYLEQKDHPLHWVFKEYLTEDNIVSFDERSNQNNTALLIQQFADDIYKIFKNRVILVKTHFTPYAKYNNNTIKINSFVDESIPFYKRSKVITDSRDIYYTQKAMSIFEKKFLLAYKTDIPYIEIDDKLYIDGNHRWGASQFHLDLESREKIAKEISNNIKNKKNLIL